MRRFANVYIILFLIDASLSLIDELFVSSSVASSLFSEIRYFVATIVITLSMIIFACLGIDRRLPKRVFLPLTIYISWCAMAMWPLSGVIARESLGLLAAGNQLLLGGIALVMLRGLGGQLLLTREHFQQPMFSLGNTLAFTAITLLLTPFVLVYSGLAVASYYLEEQTAGFLRLSPIGIYMSERSYHLDEKVVRLAGMMHIGKEDYFKDVAGSMSAKRTIILAEGVTDQDGLLETQFNYGKLAGIVGLSSQEKMHLDGNLVDLNDFDAPGQADREEDKPDIARADIDLNQFEPETVAFLNELGRSLFGDQPLLEGLAVYNVWVEEHMTPESIAAIMVDIIDKRNAVVIDGMVRSLSRYDTIIIPWGAMHMPAIEEAVLGEGFVPGAERERLSLDFRAIPYAELWRKWSEQTSENQTL